MRCFLNRGVIEQAGRPRDIYFKPRTLFVADFIGAANLHSGRIAAGQIHTPFGLLGVNAPRPRRRIDLLAPGSCHPRWPLKGRIKATAFQGSYLDLFVEAGNETVRLQLPGTLDLHIGQDIAFDVAADRVVVLEQEATHA